MAAKNELTKAPPYLVDKALKLLGENLRIARIRRHYTIKEVAQKIGTGPRAIMDAEKGKVSTGIGVYVALLWAYDLLPQLADVADPTKDEHGLILDAARRNTRARKRAPLDNDF